MTSGSFLERLKRDMARNKAKTAVLGVLCLVAIWFWLPLIKKFMKGKSAPPVATGDAGQQVSTVPASTSEPAAVTEINFDWKEFEAWRCVAAGMVPVKVGEEIQDPFALPDELVAEAQSEADSSSREGAFRPTTPDEFGLTLRGTLVGPDGAMATINGENYRVGSHVPVAAPDGSPREGFLVVEIGATYATLGRGGTLYRLELPEHGRGQPDRITIRSMSE